MPDAPTIKNTIRKRIPEYVEAVVREFSDGLGVGVAVEIDGTLYPMLFRFRNLPMRSDVLNMCDAIADTVRRIRIKKPTIAEYMADRRLH